MNLFDLDGTLLDSNGVWLQIDLDFLAKRGLRHTQEYSERVSHSIFPIAAQYTRDYYALPDTAEEIMSEWLEMAYMEYAHKIPLKPGARAFLTQEYQKGIPLVLVTASVPELCRAALRRHNLEPLFDRLIFAQELGMEKRDPRFFSQVTELLRVSPADCVLYEDAPDNCTAAKAAGIAVVGVYDDFYAENQAAIRRGTDRYIMSFEELLD